MKNNNLFFHDALMMRLCFSRSLMAWVERMVPSDQDEQFESWRKEFQQERLVRIVREREIMKETAKRCKSYQVREQEANDALERKRQAILAQRKAATVQATMRFQRNLPGFTVMDPEKFDRAIETITGRQLSNRSTPRRPSAIQQARTRSNQTFRRSISMEEIRSRPTIEPAPRHVTILARTNSVSQLPPPQHTVQYTSPLHEVQRRVLNDFAAQVQSHFVEENNNRWERESVDSLETSHQIVPPTRTIGPIVRNTPSSTSEQQEQLRRSYHESFFVKNTPVTGDEQVTAWLGVARTAKQTNLMDKAPSLDGNDSEVNRKRKSILKRSPSLDSNSLPSKPVRKDNPPPVRPAKERVRVKDSLEVINAKLLKELDSQKKTVRFAQDSSNERCASDTRLETPDPQTPLRRVQSALTFTRPAAKQTPSAHDDRASECSSTTSSKPPVYPLTPTGQMRHGYSSIGVKQRELRTKLHKTRYAQSLRQTNTSPVPFDSPSSRRVIGSDQRWINKEDQPKNDDDENGSIFSELRMSSIPGSQFGGNEARLPPPVPSNTNTKVSESKSNGTAHATTLSIEERRVQDSLDRLDRQLKEVQTRTRSTSATRTQKNPKR